MMLIFIYKITCRLDGRCYVGQTKFDVWKRFAQHCRARSKLGRAIRQLGVENFELTVLDVVNNSRADEVESAWIDALGCRFPNGFNVARGGYSPRKL